MAPRFGDQGFLEAWGHGWSCGDPDVLLPLYRPDARYLDVSSGLTFTGHDEIRRFYRWMLAFAPDSTVAFDSAHGDGDGFAARWTWSGTASGRLKVDEQIHPATGLHFSVPGVAFCALGHDGTIASHEDYYDMRAVLKQLKLLPS